MYHRKKEKRERINKPGVYRIVNKNTGQVYVGSSHNMESRIAQHKTLLKKNKHYNKKIQADYNMDPDCFVFEVLEFILDGRIEREKYFAGLETNLYNIVKVGGKEKGGHEVIRSFRVHEDHLPILMELAKADGRSVADYVRVVLHRHIETKKKEALNVSI